MSRQMQTQYINQSVPSVWAVGTDVTTSICGTTNVCILRFDNVAVNGAGIADGTTAADGTVINITRAGVYMASLTYPATAGGTINHIGITMNTNAAAYIADPGMATVGIYDYASTLLPALHNYATKLMAVFEVTKALAAATAAVRFHAGDGANATPAVGDLTEAEVRFAIHLVRNIL